MTITWSMMRDGRNRGRGRPKTRRRVQNVPPVTRFEPVDLTRGDTPIVGLTLDEIEALRLTDLEAIYQEEAAMAMGVSRSTYGRVLESARHKVALALWQGATLVIGGGDIDMSDLRPRGRGQGRGRGGGESRANGGLGFGSDGACICPRCGLRQPHQPGRPCKRERCPECNVPLLREGGEHHRAFLERQKAKKTDE